MLTDKKFRKPRIWSNNELKKFSKEFYGKIVNVSGWKDADKEGDEYKNYFTNKSEYWITNYKSEARGYQGNQENEIFIDLEKDMNNDMIEKFDVIFNHTVLEHIFEVNKAFENLCLISKDIVIIVVPFIQEQHADYGDYWRFTPLAIEKLFIKNNMDLIYINYNNDKDNSIYIFAIGSKKKRNWQSIIDDKSNKINEISTFMLGSKIIDNGFISKIINFVGSKIK